MIKKIIKELIPWYNINEKIYRLYLKSHKNYLNGREKIVDYYNYKLYKKYNCVISGRSYLKSMIRFPHPIGIIVGREVVIGENVTIYQNVTIGQNHDRFPTIGNNVIIYSGAKIIGAAAGSVVGAGIVALAELALNFVVDPIVDEITGEALINGTSIPKNGGTYRNLYSDYIQSVNKTNKNNYYYTSLGPTTSLYGMTVSYEYCQTMAQIDPKETVLGLDNMVNFIDPGGVDVLDSYLSNLASIPKDSTDFESQVNQLTQNVFLENSINGYEYVSILINELNFDPYSYAMNN